MKRPLWVIKAGSSLVAQGGLLLIREWMRQAAALQKRGVDLVWVTSGAITTGREIRGMARVPDGLAEKQALSAIGQARVMDHYNLALATVGSQGAQILLTVRDLKNSVSLKNFKATVKQLIEWRVVPILNENDAVATEEIKFGDNDSLAAEVALTLKAQRLVILSEVGAVRAQDPRGGLGMALRELQLPISKDLLKFVENQDRHGTGSGGMRSKLQAAARVARTGIEAWISPGDAPGVLTRLAEGHSMGTHVFKR